MAARERIDVLLYAHDGRGIGHASRAVAIGLALRRRHPDVRVLLVTGSTAIESLAAGAPLDWIKLPALRSELVGGRGVRVPSANGLSPEVALGLRAAMLRRLVRDLAPRLVLVDYAPIGQHGELAQALAAKETECRWVLGLRAVPGEHKAIWGDRAARLVRERYDSVLWYGDRALVGEEVPSRIAAHFERPVIECGYVSRARELEAWGMISAPPLEVEGVAALAWLTEASLASIGALSECLDRRRPPPHSWRFFVGMTADDARARSVAVRLRERRWALVQGFDDGWLSTLEAARISVAFAGYNTITDVLWAGRPAVLLWRRSDDREQQRHAELVARASDGRIVSLEDGGFTSKQLDDVLRGALDQKSRSPIPVALDGAERAADAVAEIAGRPVRARRLRDRVASLIGRGGTGA